MPANKWYDGTIKLKRLNNLISKWLLGGKDKRPFILNPARFPLTKGVLYNGVGGKRRGKYKRLDLKYLKSASYLSCRDEAVWNVLQKNLSASELVPDSAIQMAVLFPKERLDSLVSPIVLNLYQEAYIFFQVSRSVAEEIGTDALAERLRATTAQYGKKIILCPIGTALGHDDQLALQQLKILLPEDSFVLIENPSLWDIMGLIAHASLYIGGSLHGIITSMSFDVPYLFLRNRPKLVEYVSTWGVEELKGATTLENWDVRIQTAFSLEKQVLMDSRKRQLEISERSFRKMVEILDRD
jgi:polysaccharide pyruvyl transferase WcaK-like protein